MFRKSEDPIRHKSSIKKGGLATIKVSCKSIVGDSIKEEVPKFTGEETGETFCMQSEQLQH